MCEDEHFVHLNVNRYCTHLVAFLVSFIHPALSGHQNQINAFALVSITIIQSSVNSGHGIGNFCVCEDEHSVCTSMLIDTVHILSLSRSHLYTPHLVWATKSDQYLCSCVYNHNPEWCKQ